MGKKKSVVPVANPDSLKTSGPSPTFAPRGFRIEQAAIYMGLTPFYVEELIRSGQLPALQECRHYTVLREHMDAYLDEKAAAAVERAEVLKTAKGTKKAA